MDINKYRDLCRRLVHGRSDPKLTRTFKLVLLKLADLVDARKGYTAYPAFDTLAEYVGVHRTTAIRAVNVGKEIGILVRVKKGGGRKVSNRYGFRVETVAGALPFQHLMEENSSRPAPETVAARHQNSSSAATQQSKDNLIDNLILETAPPSPSFENDAVVAEGKKGVGEVGSDPPAWTTPSLEEIEYTPELRKLYERAKEIYEPGPVPQRYWRKRKQTPEEFDAEMATRGMDMSASRRRPEATGSRGTCS
jgi:Helix-turn-helix domain